MPDVSLIPLNLSLNNSLKVLPKKLDAFLSNHSFDDMLVASLLEKKDADHFFSHMYEKDKDSAIANKYWRQALADDSLVSQKINEITNSWKNLFKTSDIDLLILSQYHSCHHVGSLIEVDQQTLKITQNLRAFFNQAYPKLETILSRSGYDPRRWVYYKKPRNFSKEVTLTPDVITRLGSDIFITVVAQKVNPNDVELIYLNQNLINDLGFIYSKDEQEKLKAKIISAFSLDITSTSSDQSTDVYVDYQTDPLGISMNGNLGSGRAAYVGSQFNIKGLGRTPLAVSKNKIHSNGRVSLTEAVWETIVGNSLYDGGFKPEANPVLAIIKYKKIKTQNFHNYIDNLEKASTTLNKIGLSKLTKYLPSLSKYINYIGDKFSFEWLFETPAGLIIRLDNEMLDCPVQWLKNKHTVTQSEANKLIIKYARQDAEKFIERIFHGNWSAGNISLGGNLIDLSSVHAVIGRHPQVTTIAFKYLESAFGYEGLGQVRIINKLSDIDENYIKSSFYHYKLEYLIKGFLRLIGFSEQEVILIKNYYKTQVNELTQTFVDVSQFSFPNFDDYFTWNIGGKEIFVFDVSMLLRHLPILIATNQNRESIISLILASKNPCVNSKSSGNLPKNIIKSISSHIVGSEKEYKVKEILFENFADQLFYFINKVQKDLGLSSKKMARRAYIINEPRTYLTAKVGLPFVNQFVDDYNNMKINRNKFETTIRRLIIANNRYMPANREGFYITNYKIFDTGIEYMEINDQLKCQKIIS